LNKTKNQKGAFQVNKKIKKAIKKRKRNLAARLENDNKESIRPMFSANKAVFDMSEKISAIHCGGIGVIKELVNTLQVPEMINTRLKLLQRHKPYYESDHVLNIAYNIICGGKNLEDIELLRNNEAYLDGLGTGRIPDPTTAGDFLRRFAERDVSELMEGINDATVRMWDHTRDRRSAGYGIVDVDGKIQETFGECKEGMDISYKGVWGFSTLVTTEATSGAHLYVVNRPGNKLSQEGAGEWIDKSIDVVRRGFDKVYLRGDSAFSLTWKFDEWDEREVGFIFGYDATGNLLKKADLLGKNEWDTLERPSEEYKNRKERRKKMRVKEAVVERRGYRNLVQKNEYIGEFKYRPVKCDRDYRVIVLKKIIDVLEGQQLLFEDTRYLFYITNIEEKSAVELLRFIQGRCNHENKIEQLDNGIHALKMPAAEFIANWAYMAICMLAWNLKSWLGLIAPDVEKQREIISCEFKSFQNRLINIPCQILKAGRRIIFRFLNYNSWIEILLNISDAIRRMRFATV
jgi:hypothetical protein